MSLFGVIGNILGGAGAIASVIPGGQIIAAAASVAGSVLSGKSPTAAVTGANAMTAANQPQKTSVVQKIMSPGPLGIPWLIYGIGAAGATWLLWRRFKRHR